MAGITIAGFAAAIRELHGGNPSWIGSAPVTETFQGHTVWDGTVQVYSLEGHPSATRCYAWSYITDDGKRRVIAVLHEGTVDSPQAAVRAAIVQDSRDSSQ
jgi:hypothetical protein